MPRTRSYIGLLLCLLSLQEARAEPRDDARRHFSLGLSAAREGDFQLALERFLAAQEAFPHQATLYNITLAYLDLGDLEAARTYYALYRELSVERTGEVPLTIPELDAPQTLPPAPPPPTDRSDEVRLIEELSDELTQRLAALADLIQESQPGTASPDTTGPGDLAPQDPTRTPTSAGTPEEADTPEAPPGFLDAAYEAVVVSASRVGQDPLDSPSTVTVLTADDIRLSGVLDVPDLLRRVVGVEIANMASGQPDVAIRGFQREMNNKVLVLIDGRSTYLDFIGTTIWSALPVTLEELERVEVIRGTGSAVYGANAVTGVINLITRAPGEGGQVVRVSGGSPGLGRASVVASGRSGQGAFRLSSTVQTQGVWARESLLDGEQPDAPILWRTDPDTAAESLRFNARMDQPLGTWGAMSLSGGLASAELKLFPPGALDAYGMQIDHRYARADLFAEGVHLRAFWSDNNGTSGPDLQYVGERDNTNDFDNDVVDVELERPVAFETGPVHHQLNVGAGYRFKSIRSGLLVGGFDTPYLEHHLKAFVNEQASMGPLSLVGSLRVDRHPLIDVTKTTSPRTSLLLRVQRDTSVRLTAGSAYRAPTAMESYLDLDIITPVDGLFSPVYGDQELLPERITTLELGVHDASSLFHQADLVLYRNQISKLIAPPTQPIGAQAFDDRNNGFNLVESYWLNTPSSYLGYGAEAELELYPTDGVDLFANAALNQMIILEEDYDPTRAPELSSAPLMINLGGSVRTPWRTDVSLWANWKAPQDWFIRDFGSDLTSIVSVVRLDARLLASARVAVRPIGEQLELSLDAWHLAALLGQPAKEHPSGQPIGGRLYGSVTWRP